ncbi:hypothetical protein HK101_002422 [Irineochytrium annulatum]|nr:hypothetical protein HK101_002422 [Irineochytrium annulatum]
MMYHINNKAETPDPVTCDYVQVDRDGNDGPIERLQSWQAVADKMILHVFGTVDRKEIPARIHSDHRVFKIAKVVEQVDLVDDPRGVTKTVKAKSTIRRGQIIGLYEGHLEFQRELTIRSNIFNELEGQFKSFEAESLGTYHPVSKRLVRELGTANFPLHHGFLTDTLAIDGSKATGYYSWVPEVNDGVHDPFNRHWKEMDPLSKPPNVNTCEVRIMGWPYFFMIAIDEIKLTENKRLIYEFLTPIRNVVDDYKSNVPQQLDAAVAELRTISTTLKELRELTAAAKSADAEVGRDGERWGRLRSCFEKTMEYIDRIGRIDCQRSFVGPILTDTPNVIRHVADDIRALEEWRKAAKFLEDDITQAGDEAAWAAFCGDCRKDRGALANGDGDSEQEDEPDGPERREDVAGVGMNGVTVREEENDDGDVAPENFSRPRFESKAVGSARRDVPDRRASGPSSMDSGGVAAPNLRGNIVNPRRSSRAASPAQSAVEGSLEDKGFGDTLERIVEMADVTEGLARDFDEESLLAESDFSDVPSELLRGGMPNPSPAEGEGDEVGVSEDDLKRKLEEAMPAAIE